METAVIQTPEFERTQTSDPREAKLKDIIEKGKASLHKALEEIQHEFSIREDMAVRPTAIDFLIQDHTIQPVIRDEAYDLTDHSQGQMLTRAGIPAQFAQKLMDLDEKELLSRNLKRLTERMEDGGILLRRVGTTIKGWLSPAYKRMDAAPIMEAFLKVFYEKVAPQRIIGVEVPFTVDLVLEETGEVIPCKLTGIFDLIEADEEDTLVIVELKTSSKRFTDDQIDLDLQGTLYSYALKQIGFRTNGDETLVRYDQLLKLKNPDMETHYAVKGNVDYTWAYHLVRKVLMAIDHQIYHPIPGWQCKDCPYGKTCQQEQ